jgi:hypothetical protein
VNALAIAAHLPDMSLIDTNASKPDRRISVALIAGGSLALLIALAYCFGWLGGIRNIQAMEVGSRGPCSYDVKTGVVAVPVSFDATTDAPVRFVVRADIISEGGEGDIIASAKKVVYVNDTRVRRRFDINVRLSGNEARAFAPSDCFLSVNY